MRGLTPLDSPDLRKTLRVGPGSLRLEVVDPLQPAPRKGLEVVARGQVARDGR